VYRCRQCDHTYTLYSGTLFEGRHLTPQQVVLLIRGVLKGESSALLARELGLARSTVMQLRHLLQASALSLLSHGQLRDEHSETDEMFQNAGEKRGGASQPS
jgi:transposase-like protein